MSVKEIYTTLHDLLVEWLTNAGFRDQYGGRLDYALDDHGFDHVDADDIVACLPLVAEDLPPVYQQAIYEHMSAMSDTDGGSWFSVAQGGGEYDGVQGAGGDGGGGYGGKGGHGGEGGGESPMDAVVRHIQHIQNITENNFSYIDDSGDVTTSVTALGDVDFEQIVASGAGAVAAEGDVEGVNTGTNYGVIAGDDVDDVEVTSVFGDRNVTGEVTDDAVVVTGDDNVLAENSTVIDGDFDGGFIGGDVDAERSALNFGDGDIGQDNSIDASRHYKDSFNTDNSKHAKDSFNTDESVNDSGNTDVEVKDSFQDNSDHSVTDSGNTDASVNVKDSFTYEDETHSYSKTITTTETDIDVDVDYSDDDGKDIDIAD